MLFITDKIRQFFNTETKYKIKMYDCAQLCGVMVSAKGVRFDERVSDMCDTKAAGCVLECDNIV